MAPRRAPSAAQKARAADWLGVSSVEEGVALREAGIRLPVLVLGSLYPFESFLAAAEFGLTPTVASLDSARRLAEVARRLGRKVGCHLKIETGMGRIGMSPAAAVATAALSDRERARGCGGGLHPFLLRGDRPRLHFRAAAALPAGAARPGPRRDLAAPAPCGQLGRGPASAGCPVGLGPPRAWRSTGSIRDSSRS